MRLGIACFIILGLALALGAGRAMAQAEMPPGWETLPADQFAVASATFFDAGPTDEAAREVVDHAWQTFLNDEPFVTTGDWDTVEQLMGLFVPRRTLLVTGATYAELAAAEQQVEGDLATLQSRTAGRLGTDPALVTSSSFAEMKVLDGVLADSGTSKEERAQLFTVWMDANDWQSLSLADKGVLLGALDADLIDRSDMGARWTGFLTAPASGDYTLSQLPHYFGDAVMKVWINEQLVLDSTPTSAAGHDRFTSSPVTLTGSEPAALRVEITHKQHPPSMTDDENYPMAVLLWQTGGAEPTIIPASAYTPPAVVEGTSGMWGEYFDTSTDLSGSPVTARLDPAIDFIWAGLDDFWKWRHVAPVHATHWQDVYANGIAQLTDATALASLSAAELNDMLVDGGRHLLGAATATQRQVFLNLLLANPQKLSALEPFTVGRIVKHTYMLPGAPHVQLIAEWSAQIPQPRHQLGGPGWEEGSYEWENLQFYWHIGHFFSAPYENNLQTLIDSSLTRTDGECNLTIAYMAAWATSSETLSSRMFIEPVEEALEDETLTGDQRMTWLLAHVYAQSVMTGSDSEPLMGIELLQEAMLSATDPGKKFWALQEMVARYGSHGSSQSATALIDQFQTQFTEPDQQAAMSAWRTKIDELAQDEERIRDEKDLQQRRQQQAEHIAAAERRLADAQARGDTDGVQQYQQLIQTISNAPISE